MQVPENIIALIEKYQQGTLSDEERKLLNEWYHGFNDETVNIQLPGIASAEALGERMLRRIETTIQAPALQTRKRNARRWRMPAAAAALLLCALGIYALLQPGRKKETPVAGTQTNNPAPVKDLPPGGNKALLTLADGSTIVLDSAAKGVISLQGNIQVQKLENGQLAYTLNGRPLSANNETLYNTITTPRGGQYQVTLADGTQVWLNAASSIRIPVIFAGNTRNIELTGEAYLEVAKDPQKPFTVKTPSATIAVLGTHFNVNAYGDEPLAKTTLLEGKVKIDAGHSGKSLLLIPGQQSVLNSAGELTLEKNADVEEAVAWKNGRFQFNSADLKTILRQIARWYDVEVEYTGGVNLHFTGQLTRNAHVSKIFEQLEMTGEVHFRLEGKKIIVSP